jgi:hypothetical protein
MGNTYLGYEYLEEGDAYALERCVTYGCEGIIHK